MCGIVGWVDFARDLTANGPIVTAMTETMARRGPDAGGLWLQPHVALGHRRLAVIDLEGGGQPMLARHDGEVLAGISYSGECYNFRELREELETRGRRFTTRSDTEVVLQAYLAWGPDLVHRLNGMYAFALWDVAREELLLVRDRLGVKPLYYAALPTGVLFGSEPKGILAHPEFSPAVGVEGLRELLTMVKTPGCAVWAGMREVRPGSLVTIGRGGVRERTYWRLETRAHNDDLETTVATVRDLLNDVVERQLVADVPVCTLLSGGLDSSAITALAADSRRRQGVGPIRSFAVDLAGEAAPFQPDELRGTPDTPFAHELARHVQSEHTDVLVDRRELLDEAVRDAALCARDLPTGWGDMDTSLYLLFRDIRTQSTVALSGESADEVFGGYPWLHEPTAVAAETFPWLAAFELERVADLFDPAVASELDIGGYVAERYCDALSEVGRLDSESALERRMRELCYLHLTHFLQVLLDRKDRMSMAVGLEVRVPFCDHRLVEYVFNAPWRFKTFDGREKSLLRAATSDLVPRSIAERRKSPYPTTRDPEYDAALAGRLRAIADDPAAPVLQLVQRSRLSALAAGGGHAVATVLGRRGVELVLALNAWLAAYRPRLTA